MKLIIALVLSVLSVNVLAGSTFVHSPTVEMKSRKVTIQVPAGNIVELYKMTNNGSIKVMEPHFVCEETLSIAVTADTSFSEKSEKTNKNKSTVLLKSSDAIKLDSNIMTMSLVESTDGWQLKFITTDARKRDAVCHGS